jgi:hypothetical protein
MPMTCLARSGEDKRVAKIHLHHFLFANILDEPAGSTARGKSTNCTMSVCAMPPGATRPRSKAGRRPPPGWVLRAADMPTRSAGAKNTGRLPDGRGGWGLTFARDLPRIPRYQSSSCFAWVRLSSFVLWRYCFPPIEAEHCQKAATAALESARRRPSIGSASLVPFPQRPLRWRPQSALNCVRGAPEICA